MAKTGQGAGKGKRSTDATNATQTRRARARSSEVIQRQRVEYVLQLYVNGYSGAKLWRKVAASHAKEADARKKHRAADAKGDKFKGKEPPPLLWGLEDEPPGPRTVDRWVQQAKQLLEKRGSSVQRLGDRLMGLQLARLETAWQVALKTQRPASLVRVVEVTNDMFAFEGAIRPSLSALAASGERTGDEVVEPAPDARMTTETAVDVLGDLLAVARARRERAIAAASEERDTAANA
jgi:hypothetical protein